MVYKRRKIYGNKNRTIKSYKTKKGRKVSTHTRKKRFDTKYRTVKRKK